MSSENPNRSECFVTSIPGVGERRAYRGGVQPFAAHVHDHYVIGLIEEGNRPLVCNGRDYELAAGDLLVLNPGDVHACAHDAAGLLAYDSLAVDARFLDGMRLEGPRVRDDAAAEVFREVVRAVDADDVRGAREGVLRLCRMLASERAPEAPNRANVKAAQHARMRFRGNLADPPNLGELASVEGISTYALIRAYRSRYSITPMKHLASLRVEQACAMLRNGARPASVATQVGFADQAHMTRAFKRHVGTTPAAYQRMLAEGGKLR